MRHHDRHGLKLPIYLIGQSGSPAWPFHPENR